MLFLTNHPLVNDAILQECHNFLKHYLNHIIVATELSLGFSARLFGFFFLLYCGGITEVFCSYRLLWFVKKIKNGSDLCESLGNIACQTEAVRFHKYRTICCNIKKYVILGGALCGRGLKK